MFQRSPNYFVNRFHEKQEEAWVAYKAGYHLFLDWGRRSGKTELEAELFIEDIEDNRKDCLFIAITQGQAREIIWPKLVDRLKDLKDWRLREHNLEAIYAYGGVLSLKGADKGPDHLRGGGKRLIGCDEFAFWRNPNEVMKQVLVPMLADYNGQLIYTSTPKGKNHFYKLMLQAKANMSRYFYNKATLFDNPFIPEAGKLEIIASYKDEPNIYKQEILGEYVDFEGKVFAINAQRYVEPRWPIGELEHCLHWRGLDHGYNPDPTACIWLAYSPKREQWMIYGEYRKKQALLSTHAEVINKAWEYPFVATYSDIDPQIIAEMNALGLKCGPTGKHNKEARMLRVLQKLRDGTLKIAAECLMLLEEMETYEWEQDGNDHCIDALNYVVTNAHIPSKPAPIVIESPRRLSFDDLGNSSFGQDFDE